MSLDKFDTIPVDTHMFKIAQSYLPQYKKKSLTSKISQEIEKYFKELWGEHAGWAHTLLFSDRISVFKEKSTKRKKQSNTKTKKKRKVDEESEESNYSESE